MATDATTTPRPGGAQDSNPGGAQDFLTPQRIRLLAMAGGVLVVLALAAWFFITAGQRKEAFAAQALESARATAEQGDIGEAVQQFQQVATTYQGTAAGHDAVLGMAQARLIAGQAELAISTLEEFLDRNPPRTYASPANGLLGTALENTAKYAEAAAAYRLASEQATTNYLKATLLLDAGRALRLAGNAAEAQATYQRIVDEFAETPALSEAQVRLAELTSQAA
jgi:TolA-binding protein